MHSTLVHNSSRRHASYLSRPNSGPSRQAVVCNWTRGGGRGGYLTPLGPVIQQQAGTGGSLQFSQRQQQRTLSAEGDAAGSSRQMGRPHSTSTSGVGRAVKAAKELGKAAKQALQQQ